VEEGLRGDGAAVEAWALPFESELLPIAGFEVLEAEGVQAKVTDTTTIHWAATKEHRSWSGLGAHGPQEPFGAPRVILTTPSKLNPGRQPRPLYGSAVARPMWELPMPW
jgi:hypothetical protein